MIRMMLKLRRAIRRKAEKITLVRDINRWWREFIEDCESAENPMRWE